MSLILPALGWLTETFVASLVQKAGDCAIQWWFGVEDGDGDGQTLNKLKNSLLKIQPIVSKVENMWIEDEILKRSVNELLLQLKDAAYDAEDLLDELQYRALQQQIEQQGDEASNLSSSSSGIPPRKKIKASLSNATRRFFGKRDDKDDDVIKMMKETQGRLDGIATDVKETIAWIEANGRGKELMPSMVSRKTSSLVETRLFGRETELEELGGLLSNLEDGSHNSSISVITIVCIGGVGKTALVQEVYNKLVGGCFRCKFWVCVSENFSVERLTREMIESTAGEKCDLMNFDKLQLSIRDKIASKRFLLVLDDVWDLDSQKWERFCAPLRFATPDSKILITTRFKNIADIVGSANQLNLYGLDENSFWQYFEKCSFISQTFGDYPELEAIAKKNVYKLKGLPDGGNDHGKSFLSLISLSIDNTALLKLPSLRKGLPSILELTISSSSQEVVFEREDQELLQSLTALKKLRFPDCANLKFLPSKLHTFSSLQSLEIGNSPQVKSLPETGLPTSLTDLIVWGNCHPTLQKQSQEYSKKDKVKWSGSSN